MKIIQDRPIRVALIGYGQIAQKHIAAIKSFSDDLVLAAICDPSTAALKAAMEAHNVKTYTSLNDMFQHSESDIVVITTPSGLHSSQTIKSAQAGKHVICEKPMATRWQDALDMVKACDEAEVNLFIVKQNRAMPTIQLLKKAIDQERFGRIYQIQANVLWNRGPDYYKQSPWRGTWERDGGALMNQASHYVDLMRWLFGPIHLVSAFSSTQARRIEAEDSLVLGLKYQSGALGSMNVSMLAYPKNFEASLTVLGEKGTVRIGGVAINRIDHWEFADEAPNDREEIAAATEATTKAVGFGHPLYYENVIAVLRGNALPVTDGREGLKTMELLTAAYRSARDNGVAVHLPLEL